MYCSWDGFECNNSIPCKDAQRVRCEDLGYDWYEGSAVSVDKDSNLDTRLPIKRKHDGNPIIVPDEEIDNFNRINNNLLEKLSDENKEFVNKIHNYYDNWNNWNPTDTIETVLKNAIDKVEI